MVVYSEYKKYNQTNNFASALNFNFVTSYPKFISSCLSSEKVIRLFIIKIKLTLAKINLNFRKGYPFISFISLINFI